MAGLGKIKSHIGIAQEHMIEVLKSAIDEGCPAATVELQPDGLFQCDGSAAVAGTA